MIAVVQRVDSAKVVVEENQKCKDASPHPAVGNSTATTSLSEGTIKTTTGTIESGALVYLGVEEGDTEKDLLYLQKKISNLRIFPDERGVMNRSLLDTGGSILLISQFTLCAETSKGNRPYYGRAAAPERAKKLYQQLGRGFVTLGIPTEYGVFGAHMEVSSTNNGPVTIILNSRAL